MFSLLVPLLKSIFSSNLFLLYFVFSKISKLPIFKLFYFSDYFHVPLFQAFCQNIHSEIIFYLMIEILETMFQSFHQVCNGFHYLTLFPIFYQIILLAIYSLYLVCFQKNIHFAKILFFSEVQKLLFQFLTFYYILIFFDIIMKLVSFLMILQSLYIRNHGIIFILHRLTFKVHLCYEFEIIFSTKISISFTHL